MPVRVLRRIRNVVFLKRLGHRSTDKTPSMKCLAQRIRFLSHEYEYRRHRLNCGLDFAAESTKALVSGLRHG
jgi:hypothetical protein